jgi:hypothetical protein
MNLPNRTGTGFSLFQMLHTGPHHAQEKPHLYKHHAPLPWSKLQRVVHREIMTESPLTSVVQIAIKLYSVRKWHTIFFYQPPLQHAIHITAKKQPCV